MILFILMIHFLTSYFFFFFFNDTATTEIYTLSLHDALPISGAVANPRSLDVYGRSFVGASVHAGFDDTIVLGRSGTTKKDRKSTRLNSSHLVISYAVFCLKKKKTYKYSHTMTNHQQCVH